MCKGLGLGFEVPTSVLLFCFTLQWLEPGQPHTEVSALLDPHGVPWAANGSGRCQLEHVVSA